MMNKKPAFPYIYTKPGQNRNYKYPSGWKGTPVDSKGRFVNHQLPFYQNYVDILKWVPGHFINLLKNFSNETPVVKHATNDFFKKDNVLIWLGHASFYICLDGKRLLIDPHFNNCSLYKRHSKNPIDPNHFTSIDYILLSHDHADHLDRRSLELLVEQNPAATILTGLNMENIIRKYSRNSTLKIYCADWFEVYPLPTEHVEIIFVPSRHYSKRVNTAFNTTLWGGFIIKSTGSNNETTTIYYGGDSGAGNHFDLVKEFEPGIAILGIGAYKPIWFMKPNHMSPAQTVQAFKATGAQVLIPMHYGTFNLSNEHMNEPLAELRKHQDSVNVKTPMIGELIYM